MRATLEGGAATRRVQVRTAASAADTAEVLGRIRRILDEAAKGAFTAEELAEARAYQRGKRARSRDGSVATAAALVEEAWEAPPDVGRGHAGPAERHRAPIVLAGRAAGGDRGPRG